MFKRRHIKYLPIKGYSGFMPNPGRIPFAKKHQYFIVTDKVITGDAPKDLIRYYQYGIGRKANPQTWPLFIAKHGHKHYPMEAITERLLNRIGEVFGLNMASSDLGWFGGQIRFISRYFLKNSPYQVLDHGADLYAGYLNDREFVEEVEKKKLSPEFFTVQFTELVLKHFFHEDSDTLMIEFIKMLVFDAIIGNKDRHFYNWGIIKDIRGKTKPVFSPIYDTARGLFWNDHEDKLKTVFYDVKRLDSHIKKYSEESSPKTGWEGMKILNHFQLVEKLKTSSYIKNCDTIKNICGESKILEINNMIDNEFSQLMSYERKELIKLTLKYRHSLINKIFTFAP